MVQSNIKTMEQKSKDASTITETSSMKEVSKIDSDFSFLFILSPYLSLSFPLTHTYTHTHTQP